MFVKRLLQKVVAVDTPTVPAGNLKASHLQPQLVAHHGIVHSASILAFEPVQRLLAVASTDGRVKLLGADGIQALLQSPWALACKYLEFMNNRGFLLQVNVRNHIEVWDYAKRELVCHEIWDGDITSFYVLQGSPFIFVGEHSGLVVVLQYVEDEQLLKRMPYGIPAHITLGGVVGSGSHDAPCVVAILAQPDVFYSRLLIAYGNGLIVLWGLHENRVLAVRGGSEMQQCELADYANSLKSRALATPSTPFSDDEDEKEISCVCWVCPIGSVVAVGYIDGEILLWSLPSIMKAKGQMDVELVEGPPYSGQPLMTVDLAPGKAKSPVVGLTWCSSGNSSRGTGGRLYVFGGGEKGRPEALMVISLDASHVEEGGVKLVRLDLPLEGAFADMVLLPPWPAGDGLCSPAAALAVLMSPGLLRVYDELSIASYFAALAEGTPSPPPPQPVPLQLPVTETNVTCAKLVFVSNDGVAAKALLQKPPISNSSVLPTLPGGTKWPISGGKHIAVGSSSTEGIQERNLYLTGHQNGLVSFWDASSPSYNLICTVKYQSENGGDRSVTAFDFCGTSGLLAVGDELGMVSVYRVQKGNNEVNCRIIGRHTATLQEEAQHGDGTFVCFLVLMLHEAAIRSIALAGGLSRLAVGDDSGQVSMVDLQTATVILYDSCFPDHPSSILSLAFSAASTSIPQTTPSSSPRITRQQVQASHVPILYVVGKHANMVAYEGVAGAVLGHGAFHPKNSSTAVSVHLLDAEGSPLSLPGAPVDEPVRIEDEDTESTEEVSDSSEETSSTVFWNCSEAQYLLLCCTDSLRLYGISAFVQGQSVHLKKVRLEKTCCWTAVFREKSKGSGLILLYTDGDIEFRSLPDLEYVKATSLSNWKIDLDEQVMQSLGCSINGRLILMDHGKEVVQLSCLLEDAKRDQQLPQPQLYDSELALADAHASTVRNISKKKVSGIPGMEGLLKGVVGGVIKELKNALDPEVQHVHCASELPKLFSTRPFTISSPSVSSGLKTGGDFSSSDILDIDDIDVDEVQSAPQAPPETSSSGGFGKFMRNLKGKEKEKEKASRDPESDRMKLFDGNDAPPKQQTVDDIRAKYGHPRKSQEISSVVEMARNKLMERGEKLQGIEDKTSELEDNASNFASMAEELAKKMAARKWWEL
ncbi:hypothetical protein R1flu_027871 [Riccia fluitans]|uniref:V-SNARE coiled-coil homology domain-containing protein n=1 Tax=Riccia fluitans TaxID=41844 RepID=A0ABD1XP34_9MARC